MTEKLGYPPRCFNTAQKLPRMPRPFFGQQPTGCLQACTADAETGPWAGLVFAEWWLAGRD